MESLGPPRESLILQQQKSPSPVCVCVLLEMNIGISAPNSVFSGVGSVTEFGDVDESLPALDTSIHLQLLFQYYCRFGRSGVDHDIDTLDNSMYAKFARDCPGLLLKPLNPAECDLLFVKHKSKTLRRINYGQVRFPTGCSPPAPTFTHPSQHHAPRTLHHSTPHSGLRF